MRRNTRLVLAAVAGLFVFGCLGTLGAVFIIGRLVGGLGETPTWSQFTIPQRLGPQLFGVSFPGGLLHYESRESGFQDPFYEVLIELPPEGVEPFFVGNGLSRGGERVQASAEVLARIKTLEPKHGPFTVTVIALPEPDGGVVDGRNAVLLEDPAGHVWVSFEAFAT